VNNIKISPVDNVAVAIAEIEKGTLIEGVILLKDAIPRGHKFALTDIAEGENVTKYSFPIGCATRDIEAGEWVHTHNLRTNLDADVDYEYKPKICAASDGIKTFFRGYRRADGKCGVRNEIWIIPTVGCINSVAENLASCADAQSLIRGSIDGIHAFPHPYGCSQLGEDHLSTQKILAGLVNHPNAGGILVLGLGCENNNLTEFKRILGDVDESRVKFLNCQDSDDEFSDALALVAELCATASSDAREEIPSDELIIGLKCGGSDGFSGITANPATGVFSDLLVYGGGTTILTEVPEMFGAETILMERCESRDVFDKTVSLINNFKDYFTSHGQTVYENPSPGNKDGGISTLEEKSLGCTQKCGTAPVTDVLDYGERVKKRGLNLLNSPGNDLVASTALAASGAHIVIFTTGRGTPFGCPCPTVKVSTNTALAEKKSHWIDFNAGLVLENSGITQSGRELFDYVIKLASGDVLTKNETNKMSGIAIFKNGVTL